MKCKASGLEAVWFTWVTSAYRAVLVCRALLQLTPFVVLSNSNVPNALNFIDKYTQVGRILRPIVTCIEKIDSLMANPGLRAYLESSFGGTDRLKKVILCDFFRHGFDGSGADNSFDAGSCIDGRLTSAWNWCSKIAKKSYFPVFQLTDFMGFDGDFR